MGAIVWRTAHAPPLQQVLPCLGVALAPVQSAARPRFASNVCPHVSGACTAGCRVCRFCVSGNWVIPTTGTSATWSPYAAFFRGVSAWLPTAPVVFHASVALDGDGCHNLSLARGRSVPASARRWGGGGIDTFHEVPCPHGGTPGSQGYSVFPEDSGKCFFLWPALLKCYKKNVGL